MQDEKLMRAAVEARRAGLCLRPPDHVVELLRILGRVGSLCQEATHDAGLLSATWRRDLRDWIDLLGVGIDWEREPHYLPRMTHSAYVTVASTLASPYYLSQQVELAQQRAQQLALERERAQQLERAMRQQGGTER